MTDGQIKQSAKLDGLLSDLVGHVHGRGYPQRGHPDVWRQAQFPAAFGFQ